MFVHCNLIAALLFITRRGLAPTAYLSCVQDPYLTLFCYNTDILRTPKSVLFEVPVCIIYYWNIIFVIIFYMVRMIVCNTW